MFPSYNAKIGGFLAPGFEPVREVFKENFLSGLESRAQLCVFLGEEKVIGSSLSPAQHHPVLSLDLHGSIHGDDEFGPTNLLPIFSAGKVILCRVEKNPNSLPRW